MSDSLGLDYFLFVVHKFSFYTITRKRGIDGSYTLIIGQFPAFTGE